MSRTAYKYMASPQIGRLTKFNTTFSYPDLARIDIPEGAFQIGEQIYFFFVSYTVKYALYYILKCN